MKKKLSDLIVRKKGYILLLLIAASLRILIANGIRTEDIYETQEESIETQEKALDFVPYADNDNQIIIPAVTGLNMKSKTTEQSVDFYNPGTNNCIFKISIYLSDDTLIYRSDKLYPAERIHNIELMKELDVGLYRNVRLVYDCYSLSDSNTKLNSCDLVLEINSN